jgi:hypothetical protein
LQALASFFHGDPNPVFLKKLRSVTPRPAEKSKSARLRTSHPGSTGFAPMHGTHHHQAA